MDKISEAVGFIEHLHDRMLTQNLATNTLILSEKSRRPRACTVEALPLQLGAG